MTLRPSLVRLGVLAGCALAFATAFGCSSEAESGTTPQKRMILLTNGNSPFWDAARAGLREAGEKLGFAAAGLVAVMEVNDGTPQGQIDKLRQFGSQSDIAGIAVSALDANNLAVANEMKKLRAKGVHVITVDADVDRERFRDARSYYLGTDNLVGGRVLGIAARGLLQARGVQKGSYAQFVGRTGSHNAIERMGGFQEAVGKEYTEADRMGDDLDRTKARDNVRNAIRNHSDLVALVGIWSYNAPAIVDVVTQEKVRDKYTIVVFDAEPLAIKQLGEGSIDAMVVQNPFKMGYEAMRLLKAMHQKDADTIKAMYPRAGEPGGDILDTGLKVVVPDTGTPLKAESFDGVQFLKLAEFVPWLDKYGLKGS